MHEAYLPKKLQSHFLKLDNVLFIWPDKCKNERTINLNKDSHLGDISYLNPSLDKMTDNERCFVLDN